MTTPLSLATRMARVIALRGEIDANGGGQMLFFEGALPESPDATPAVPPFATMPLATPTCGAVEAIGTPMELARLSLTPVSVLASARGAVGFVRIADGAGAGVMDLRAGLVGSEMPVILDKLLVYAGGELNLVSCEILE